MIDIHCHILPGIDDGPKTIEDSLEMAKIAVNEGIKTIINTSHYHPDFDFKKGAILINEVKKFNETLKENNIELEVLIGNEIYYTNDLLQFINNKEFFTLNNSRYLLIEFQPINFPKNIVDIVYELKIRGYIPILAHVERYEEMQENPNLVYECIKEGALIQINASSFKVLKSKDYNNIINILLNNNMVHFIATDAHSTNRRRPNLKSAYNYVLDNHGKDMANKLFYTNAKSVIEDRIIDDIDKPIKYEKVGIFKRLFKK